MGPTERLHHDDPLRLAFSARVVAHARHEGKASVVLDRTAFYPESGGQMGDRGSLGGSAVADVQVDEAGVVHHLLAEGAEAPAVGSEVAGSIDKARRRTHMALHTGQHLLSRALVQLAGAATVSSRLGESGCTLDVDREVLDEKTAAEAEALVNALVDDDVPVRSYFPEPGELAALDVRAAPKVTGPVRVVVIGAFDVCPCGGTHCTTTAQVGLLRVTGMERYKGKARLLFSAGPRARRELWDHAAILRALGQELTCGPHDVSAAVDKLRRELSSARDGLGALRGRLAGALAAELRAGAPEGSPEGAVVVGVIEDASLELVRAVATQLTAAPGAVALLGGRTPDGLVAIAARGSESRFDCGAFLKRAAAAAGGRGGGRAERAEGRLPREVDWVAVARAALGQAG